MDESTGVHIEGITALVTGANRGLGKAFVQELLDRGAQKVYAAARDTDTVDISDERVIPVRLDITNADAVESAAHRCADVSLVINNAGAMLQHLSWPHRTPAALASKWRPTTSAP